MTLQDIKSMTVLLVGGELFLREFLQSCVNPRTSERINLAATLERW
jgi:hypothetical protein